jgi:hypothetical protein
MQKKGNILLLTLFFISFLLTTKAQPAITPKQAKPDSVKNKEYKPEIFTSGFIDVMNNGQVNGSARFIRLLIGEPGKFAIPLSLYGGVSNNNFQNQNGGGQLLKSNTTTI